MQVKAGICCAHLDSDPSSQHGMQQAQQYFTALLLEPAADSADLCLTVADELLHLGHAEEVGHLEDTVSMLAMYANRRYNAWQNCSCKCSCITPDRMQVWS